MENNDETFEECLIDLVREYDNLWKVTSTKYKDLQRMQNSWEEIGEKLAVMGFKKSFEDCKLKWRYLRDTFKKKKSSTQAEKVVMQHPKNENGSFMTP